MPFAPSMVGTSVPSSFGTRRRVLRGTEAYVFRVPLCPGARVLLGSVFCFCAPYARFLEALAELLA